MARQRTRGERVLGPYKDRGDQWRIIILGTGDDRVGRLFPTKEQADRAKRIAEREIAEVAATTLREAIEAYEMYLREEKRNRMQSVMDSVYRLGLFYPDGDEPVSGLTPAKCQTLYKALRERKSRLGKVFSNDSTLNILAEAKTFGRWCVTKSWLKTSPLESIKGLGRRRHGKEQLRIDEARRWIAKAVELADAGEAGAVAAMMALVMGMRAKEIVSREVRDLDDGGKLLWIPTSKTAAGRRTLQVAEVLRPYLLRQVEGKVPTERIFGKHWRDWVRKWVQKICAKAKVPMVTAHGMRGLHSTLAVEHGVSAHVVAASLGHTSSAVTMQSYVKPEAAAGARQRQVLSVLTGARTAEKPHRRRTSPRGRNSFPQSFRSESSRKIENEFSNDLVEMNGIEPSAS